MLSGSITRRQLAHLREDCELSNVPSTLPEAFIEAESRNASLGARLAAYRDSTRRIRPDIAKAYDDLVARLDMLDNGAIGPQVG